MTFSPLFIARFWSKVDVLRAGSCWVWHGSLDSKGYGHLKAEKKNVVLRAHAVAYELFYGAIVENLFVCHRCDNPPCCNPSHLFLGTHSDNMCDARDKGRLPQLFERGMVCGEKNPHSILTNSDVRVICSMIISGINNKEISKKFNVTHSMISRIRLKKSWIHISDVVALPNFKYGKIV